MKKTVTTGDLWHDVDNQDSGGDIMYEAVMYDAEISIAEQIEQKHARLHCR